MEQRRIRAQNCGGRERELRDAAGRDISLKKAEGDIEKGLGGVGEGVLIGLCQS